MQTPIIGALSNLPSYPLSLPPTTSYGQTDYPDSIHHIYHLSPLCMGTETHFLACCQGQKLGSGVCQEGLNEVGVQCSESWSCMLWFWFLNRQSLHRDSMCQGAKLSGQTQKWAGNLVFFPHFNRYTISYTLGSEEWVCFFVLLSFVFFVFLTFGYLALRQVGRWWWGY